MRFDRDIRLELSKDKDQAFKGRKPPLHTHTHTRGRPIDRLTILRNPLNVSSKSKNSVLGGPPRAAAAVGTAVVPLCTTVDWGPPYLLRDTMDLFGLYVLHCLHLARGERVRGLLEEMDWKRNGFLFVGCTAPAVIEAPPLSRRYSATRRASDLIWRLNRCLDKTAGRLSCQLRAQSLAFFFALPLFRWPGRAHAHMGQPLAGR